MSEMLYNGQKVELITSGYWPDGIDLICSDDGENWREERVVCLHDNRCLRTPTSEFVDITVLWRYWSVKPQKPAPRRLTNREVYRLWRNGWDILNKGNSVIVPCYCIEDENTFCDWVKLVRAPESEKWIKPTSDLLEALK